MKKPILILCAILLLSTTQASAGLKDWVNKATDIKNNGAGDLAKTSLSDTRIADGLKEALKVGINNAIDAVGREGGYSLNDAIKIQMPDKLTSLDKALRMIGMDEKLDEFILGMNRAAETAAPQARDIFIDSLLDMTLEDVQALYSGGDTAATDFFNSTAREDLYNAFKPIVDNKLNEFDVIAQYKSLLAKYQTIPFASKLPNPDVDVYVINKALDGLFHTLGQEEKAIRTNPSARVTDLLKDVFGK